MMPSSPHSITIGTGERRAVLTLAFNVGDQVSMGPSDVVDQSKAAMSRAI
jgi:hypothetical protein